MTPESPKNIPPGSSNSGESGGDSAEKQRFPAPMSLKLGGRALWDSLAVVGRPEPELVLLLEACRAKDRLDELDRLLCADIELWASLTHRLMTEDYELVIDKALAAANSTAGVLRQLLALIPAGVASSGEQPKAANPLDELNARRSARGSSPPRPSRTAR